MNFAKYISTIGVLLMALIVIVTVMDKGYTKMADPVTPEKIVGNVDYKKYIKQIEQAESETFRTGMILREKTLKSQTIRLASEKEPKKVIPRQKQKKATSNKSGDQTSEFSAFEKKLLAKAVYSEARGESFRGQVAVAAVILNRIDHASFPNSVRGVIYQENAFTAVADGQINLEPDQKAVDAVEKAIQGEDPTHGAVYYYNPKIATSDWMDEKAVKSAKTRIGKHVFMK